MISAAGQAEYDPLAENDNEENKAINRRVEVIFVPTIEELPELSESTTEQQPTEEPPALPEKKKPAGKKKGRGKRKKK